MLIIHTKVTVKDLHLTRSTPGATQGYVREVNSITQSLRAVDQNGEVERLVKALRFDHMSMLCGFYLSFLPCPQGIRKSSGSRNPTWLPPARPDLQRKGAKASANLPQKVPPIITITIITGQMICISNDSYNQPIIIKIVVIVVIEIIIIKQQQNIWFPQSSLEHQPITVQFPSSPSQVHEMNSTPPTQ